MIYISSEHIILAVISWTIIQCLTSNPSRCKPFEGRVPVDFIWLPSTVTEISYELQWLHKDRGVSER